MNVYIYIYILLLGHFMNSVTISYAVVTTLYVPSPRDYLFGRKLTIKQWIVNMFIRKIYIHLATH